MASVPGSKPKSTSDSRSTPSLLPLGVLAGKSAIVLNRPVFTVGARENNRLRLVSRTISQNHGLLVNSNGGTYVCDLASREGVLVNDVKVRLQPLHGGDRVQFGKFIFEYRAAKGAATTIDTAPPRGVIRVDEGPQIPFDSNLFLIGRREKLDLSLSTDPTVSALHTVIFPVNGEWYIRDMGSRTGTLLNGKKIHQEKLSFDDEIKVGTVTMRFEPAIEGAPAISETEDAPLSLEDELPVEPEEQLSVLPTADFGLELDHSGPTQDAKTVDEIEIEPAKIADEPLPLAEEPAAPEPVEAPLEPRRSWRSELAKDSKPPFVQPLQEESLELDLGHLEPEPHEESEAVTAKPEAALPAAEVPLDLEEWLSEDDIAGEPAGAFESEPASSAENTSAIDNLARAVSEGPLDLEDWPHEDATPAPSAEILPVEPAPAFEAAAAPEADEPLDLEDWFNDDVTPAAPVAEAAPVLPVETSAVSEAAAEPETEEPLDLEDWLKDGDVTTDPARQADSSSEQTSHVAEVVEHADVSPTAERAAEQPAEFADELDLEDWLKQDETSSAADAGLPNFSPEPAAPEPAPDHADLTDFVELLDSSRAELQEPVELESIASADEDTTLPVPNFSPSAEEPAVAAEINSEKLEEISAEVSDDALSAVEPDTLDLADLVEQEPSPTVASASTEIAEVSDTPEPAPEFHAVANVPADIDLDISQTFSSETPPVPEQIETPAFEPVEPLEFDNFPAVEGDIDQIPLSTLSEAPPADEPPAVEVLDQTEPTLESALDLDAAVASPGPSVGDFTETNNLLSDTNFGRAVEEFSGSSTGPIVESPRPTAEVHPMATAALMDDLVDDMTTEPIDEVADIDELDEFVAIPEDVPLVNAEDTDTLAELDEIRPPSDPLIIEEPLPAATAPLEPPIAPAVIEAVAPAVTTEKPAVISEAVLPARMEEPAPIVAAPIQVSIEPAHVESIADEIPQLDPVPGAEVPAPLVIAEKIAPIASPPTITSTPQTVQSQVSTARARAAIPPLPPLPPQIVPGPPPAAIAPAAPAKPTPPIFGFSFDGASFIGGLPLKLKDPPASFGKVGYAFDSKANSLTSSTAPSAPPIIEPKRPTSGAFEKPVPSRGSQSFTQPAAANAATTRAATPPPPRIQPGRSLTNLAPEPESNSIPTLVDEMIVPPLATPTRQAKPTRQALSTAFSGLGATSTDVFSKTTATIGAGLAGALQSPEIDRTPAPQSFGAPIKLKNAPASAEIPPAQPAAAQPAASRKAVQSNSKMRIPVLFVLMAILIGGTWAAVYTWFPHFAKITGQLNFSNLDKLPMAEQQNFQHSQLMRLGGEEVRTIAKSVLAAEGTPVGFLENPVRFEEAVNKNGKVEFDGNTLQIVCQSTDRDGKPQMAALLLALSQNDADLVDAQARAKNAADAAKTQLDKSTYHLDELKSEIKSLQAAGDQRPDPNELAREETDAARLNKLSEETKNSRVELQLAWDALRQIDTTKPLNADTDPELTQLRKQVSDLKTQIAQLKTPPLGDAPGSVPSPDSNAELIKQLQSQIDADQSKIDQRAAVIQADQRLSPQQRDVNRQKAVEELTIKLATLQTAEKDTADNATAATARAQRTRQKLETAQLATSQLDALPDAEAKAETDVKAKSAELSDKLAALAKCVVPVGKPQIDVDPMPDQRPIVAGIPSGVIFLVFIYMILLAARNHAKIVVPAPVSPLPWPQPAPANGDPAAATGDESQQDHEAIPV